MFLKYKKIPKIVHFYWGKNTPMSFLQYLTIRTFKKYNPDWEVKLSVPKYPSLISPTWSTGEQKEINLNFDFFDESKKYVDTIKEIDFDAIGFLNNISEIHKSDFIRLYLLATEGGLWSDMDIIYIKPMEYLDIPENIDLGVVYHQNNKVTYHLIGFMLASNSNDYFNFLLDNSLMYFKKDIYQSIGANLINILLPTIESIKQKFPKLSLCNLNMDVVYSYNHFNLEKLITTNQNDLTTNKSIGVHWFNGDHRIKNFIGTIDPYNIKSDTMLGNLIKEYQL